MHSLTITKCSDAGLTIKITFDGSQKKALTYEMQSRHWDYTIPHIGSVVVEISSNSYTYFDVMYGPVG